MTVFESGTRVPFMVHVPGVAEGKRTSELVEAVDLFPSLIDLAAGESEPPSYLDGISFRPLLQEADDASALANTLTAADAGATTGARIAPISTAMGPSVWPKQGAYSEFVKCYSCCRVPDDQACLPGGTQGRCAPTSPEGLADLSEMGNCFKVPREQIDFIGYSVRTARWRFTEWLHFNGTILHGDWRQPVVGRELYDHATDKSRDHDWDQYENENVVKDPGNAGEVASLHRLLQAGFPFPVV
jgi:hypothetical protein